MELHARPSRSFISDWKLHLFQQGRASNSYKKQTSFLPWVCRGLSWTRATTTENCCSSSRSMACLGLPAPALWRVETSEQEPLSGWRPFPYQGIRDFWVLLSYWSRALMWLGEKRRALRFSKVYKQSWAVPLPSASWVLLLHLVRKFIAHPGLVLAMEEAWGKVT